MLCSDFRQSIWVGVHTRWHWCKQREQEDPDDRVREGSVKSRLWHACDCLCNKMQAPITVKWWSREEVLPAIESSQSSNLAEAKFPTQPSDQNVNSEPSVLQASQCTWIKHSTNWPCRAAVTWNCLSERTTPMTLTARKETGKKHKAKH